MTGVALLVVARRAVDRAARPRPTWWPIDERWWLPGGLATAITQIASALVALALIVWSYRRFHGNPDAVAELEEEIDEADEEAHWRHDD